MNAVLVLNAGSSSLKFALYDATGRCLHGQLQGMLSTPSLRVYAGDVPIATQRWDAPISADSALDCVLDGLQSWAPEHSLGAVGHRVVHGGLRAQAARVDAALLAELDALTPLAPLHQPANLAAIRRIAARAPTLPQVACFDTAFHRTQNELQQRYALPPAWFDAGVRRYGYHGLSYQWIASQLPALDADAAAGRSIVLHLGNGCSLCALARGRSVATSMGFSTLDGVPMATRSGALDPGVLLYLLRQGLSLDALEDLLYRQSGWLGVSGLSADMRVLLASEQPSAWLAIALFVERVVAEVGALAATLGGLDALVFTGGIGENAATIRAAICTRVEWLGLRLDPSANATHGPRISHPDSRLRAYVLPTNEEAVIARETQALVQLGRTG